MTITKTVDLPVGLNEAFALITEPERLRRWQSVIASVDLRVGGEFHWTVTPGNRAAGTFKEIEPGKRIVYGWGWDGGEPGPDSSTVTVTLEPIGDGTRVTVTHEGLSAEDAPLHAEGWTHYLERLQRVATTGDAGSDEWAWAPDPIDPIIAAEASLAVLQPVLRGLVEADRTAPTPCAEFDGHALAEHLFESLVGLGGMAGVTITRPDSGSLEDRVSVMAGEVIRAWSAHDGATTVGGDLPSDVARSIISIELLVHAWDFARTSGQEVRASDELVNYVAERARPIIDNGRSRGAFGAEITSAEGANALDRLAAFAGRAVPVPAA